MSLNNNNNNIIDLIKKKKEIIKEKRKQNKSHNSISTNLNNNENTNELSKNTLINNFVTSQKLIKDLQKRNNISLDTSLYLFNVEVEKIQKITKCAKWKNAPYIYQKSATEILLRKNEYINEFNKKHKKNMDRKISQNNIVTKRYSSNLSTHRNNNKQTSIRSQTLTQPIHKNLENANKQTSIGNIKEKSYSKKKNNYNNENNLKNSSNIENVTQAYHPNSYENVNKCSNCFFRCNGIYSTSTNLINKEKDENSNFVKENKLKNIKNYNGMFYENTNSNGLKKNDYYYYDNNNNNYYNSNSRPRNISSFSIDSEKEKHDNDIKSNQDINKRNSIWCLYGSNDLKKNEHASISNDENNINKKYLGKYFCYNNENQDSDIPKPFNQEHDVVKTKCPEMKCSYFNINNSNSKEYESEFNETKSNKKIKKTIPNFERHTVSSFIKNLSVQKEILEKKQKKQVRENLKRMPTKQIVENSKKTYSLYDKATQDNLKILVKSQKKNDKIKINDENKKNDKTKTNDSSFEKIWNTVLKKQDTLYSVKNTSPNNKYDLYHIVPFNDNYSWVRNLRNYSSPAKLNSSDNSHLKGNSKKVSEKKKEENKTSSNLNIKNIKNRQVYEKATINRKGEKKDEQNKSEVNIYLPKYSPNCKDNIVEENNNLEIKESNCFYNNYVFCGNDEQNENSDIGKEDDNEENKNNMKEYISILENVKQNLKEEDKNPLEKFNEKKSNNNFETYEYVKNNENSQKNNKIFEILINPQNNINNQNKTFASKYSLKHNLIENNNNKNLISNSKKSMSNVSNNLFGYKKYFQHNSNTNNLIEKKENNKYFTPVFQIPSPFNDYKSMSFQKNNVNVNIQNNIETNTPIQSRLMCNSCHTNSNIKNVEFLNNYEKNKDKIIYNQSLINSKELNTKNSNISNSSRNSKKCNEENINKPNDIFMFFSKNINVSEKETNINNKIDNADSTNNIDAESDQNYSCYKTLCVYNKFLNKNNEYDSVNTLEEAQKIEKDILEKQKSNHFCLNHGMKIVTKNPEKNILNNKTDENVGQSIIDVNINVHPFSIDKKPENEQIIEKNNSIKAINSVNSISMTDVQTGVSCFNIGCSYNSVDKSNNELKIKKEIAEPMENYRINGTNVDAKIESDNAGCYFNLCKNKGVNSQEYFTGSIDSKNLSFENIKNLNTGNDEKRKTISIFDNKNISNNRKQTYFQDSNDEDMNLLKRKETYNNVETLIDRKQTYNLNFMDNKNKNNLKEKINQEYVYVDKYSYSNNYEVIEMKESIMNNKRATTYSYPNLKGNSIDDKIDVNKINNKLKNEGINSNLFDNYVFIKNKIAIPKLRLDQLKHKNSHHFDISSSEIKNPESFSIVQCNKVHLFPFIPLNDKNVNFSKNKQPDLLKIESNYLSTLNLHKTNRNHTFNNNEIGEKIVKNNNILSFNPKKTSTTSACSRSHTFNLNQKKSNINNTRLSNNNIITNLNNEKYDNTSNPFCLESFVTNAFPIFRKNVNRSNSKNYNKSKLHEYQSKTIFQDLKNNKNVFPNCSDENANSESVDLKLNDSVNCLNPCICQNVPKTELTNDNHLDAAHNKNSNDNLNKDIEYIKIESQNIIDNSQCNNQNKSFEKVNKNIEEKNNNTHKKQSYKDIILNFFGIKKIYNEKKDDTSNNFQNKIKENNVDMNIPKLCNTKSLCIENSFHRFNKNNSNKNFEFFTSKYLDNNMEKNTINKNSNILMEKQPNNICSQKYFTRNNINKQNINKTEIKDTSSIHNNNNNSIIPINKINSTLVFSNYINNNSMNINTNSKTFSLSFLELKNKKPSSPFISMNKANSNSIHNHNLPCNNLNNEMDIIKKNQNDKIDLKVKNNNIISNSQKVSSYLPIHSNLNFPEKIKTSTIEYNNPNLNEFICVENTQGFNTCNNCLMETENIKKDNFNSVCIKETPLNELVFKDKLTTENNFKNKFIPIPNKFTYIPNKPTFIPNIGIQKIFGNRITESNLVDSQNNNIDAKFNIIENKNMNNESLEINKKNIDVTFNFKEDTYNKCYNTYHQKNLQIVPFNKSDKKIIIKESESENKQVLNKNYTNLFISKSTIDILNKKINNVIYNPHSINIQFNQYDNMDKQNTDFNNIILKSNISKDSKNSTTSTVQQHIHLSTVNQGHSHQLNNIQENENSKKNETLLIAHVLSDQNKVMQWGEAKVGSDNNVDAEKRENEEGEEEEDEEEEDEKEEDEEEEDEEEGDAENENGDAGDDDDENEKGDEGDGDDYEDDSEYEDEEDEEEENEEYEEEENEEYEEEENEEYEEEENEEYEEEENEEYEEEENGEDEEEENGEDEEEENGEDEEEENGEDEEEENGEDEEEENGEDEEEENEECNREVKYPQKYMKKLSSFNNLNIKNDKYKKLESSNEIFVLSSHDLSIIPNKNILNVYPSSTSSSFNINFSEKKRKSNSTMIGKGINNNKESNEDIYKNSENMFEDKKIPMTILRNNRDSPFNNNNNNNSYKFFDEISKQVECEKKNNEQLKKKLKEQIYMQRNLSKLSDQQYAHLQFLKHKDVYNMNGNIYS
ncbi:conserved Plasmodium protein, unknown function [Plasmodium berghei]|uniref:Uncharacterized protein n=2 Tax=Plasmodium berghei TaxID=5821 RepID=A0A509AP59_PLABA|nr:conserved Plasmodium protein, unknown function [Plasmodium berghei ANKA]CXI60883.1 conserved Plasmodium protein, unknown function [Plasmodium berghei]VUC56508.1 conserved Plasmodium protein, unknown function [Plasmodium berghei ANKA]|eukprot:XP_034422294.1 conserved Plasmodium protein, unknown function [Plasmodium berghei ANKA]